MRVAVTGAFGYSGRYIASRLLQAGHTVITLTNSLNRPSPFGQKVPAFPLQFEQPGRLAESLRGCRRPHQHLLGQVRSPPLLPQPGRRQHQNPVPGRQGRWRQSNCSRQHHQPGPPLRPLLFPRQGRTGIRPGCPSAFLTASSARPFYSARKTFSSTTSPGPCATFPFSAFSATANTNSSPSMWTTWLPPPSNKPPATGTKSSTPSEPKPSLIANWSKP